jgi:hypothetical protein
VNAAVAAAPPVVALLLLAGARAVPAALTALAAAW